MISFNKKMEGLFLRTFLAAVLISLNLICTTKAFALPGVTPYIDDASGEYVFYKDNSFSRTSYIGFLYYNESTYAARYYAPSDSTKSLVEKDITLYLTINPENSQLEFTGENMTGLTSNDDADVVNYIHDLFYELSARRQNLEVNGIQKVTVKQDYAQFGGTVTLNFSSLVPIFNLDSIVDLDGTPIIQVQTAGLLTSSNDKSFSNFKGFENLPADKKRSFNKKMFAKKAEYNYENQTVTLDNQWTQSMDNLWLLGDSALLTLNVINTPEVFTSSKKDFTSALTRKLMQSTEGSYSVWPRMIFNADNNTTKITNLFYQPESGNVTRDFKIITKLADGKYNYFTLTVFESVYEKNKKYFDKIIKSYK